MADELKRVGLVFKADGTVDFNKSLKEVNASIKENYSAFKLAKSQWDENTKASEKLKDQQKYLSAEIKDYTDKVKMLQGQLSELSEKESKNAEKIKKKTEQLDAARNTAESYKQKCDALKIELEQLEKDENSNAEAIQKKKNQVEKAEKAYVDYSSKAEKLETDIEKLNSGEANNEAAIQKKKAQLENTQAALNNYKKSLEEVNEKLKYGTADIEEYGKKLEETGEKISKAGKKIDDAGSDLTKKVTVPIAGLATAAVKTAADFESAMSQVQATMGITKDAMSEVDGQNVNTMDTLSNLAKEMGETTAFSATKCAEAINYLALAGYNTQQICDTLPTVLNLAAAGGFDLATASDMVTDAMSALDMSADRADMMVDQMAKTASSTNTSVEQLGEGILKIGATAKSIKGGTEELNTALGILANNGIKGAEGGTHLRNVILSLQSPTDTAASLLNELGVSAYDSNGQMRSLNDILGDLNVSMDGMTSAERDNIISTIFNKTDLAAVNALLANTGETWDSLQSSITNSSGDAQQMADTQLDNLSGQLTILMSQLEALAISFGETMMPVIRDVVSGIQGFVDKLNAMDEGQRRTIITIALVLAAIGPVLITIGKITTGISGVTKGIGFVMEHSKTLASVASTVMGGIGKGASALFGLIAANPVIAIIMAIIAVVILLYNKCEWFRDGVDSIIGSVVGFFQNFDDNVAKVKEGVTQKFNDIKSSAIGIFDDIKNGIKEKIEWARDKVKGAVDAIKGFFDFQWSLPKIKLPHFSVTGKFGLNPPSIPRFNVEWYAKGGILNRPTIFGANGDDLMGGGEAGPEAVMPISLLKQYIRDEIQQNNSLLAQLLVEAIKSLEIKAVNNITIGDKRLYQLITEMVIKEISSKVGSQRASKGVRYV